MQAGHQLCRLCMAMPHTQMCARMNARSGSTCTDCMDAGSWLDWATKHQRCLQGELYMSDIHDACIVSAVPQ